MGARAVHNVLQALDVGAPLAAFVVWINVLPEDKWADVQALSAELAQSRIQWFDDPERRLGKLVAASLGGAGQIAWDVYIGFDAQARWIESMPPARDWVHQLSDRWADPSRMHVRGDLEPALARLVGGLLSS